MKDTPQERWRQKNLPKVRADERARYKKHLDYHRRKNKEYADNLKDKIFLHYGGYVCACCKEIEKAFLQIDHIDGGGNEHRRQISKYPTGRNFYRWLKKNGFPDGYQVLCANCNWGKRLLGICPHKLNGTNVL